MGTVILIILGCVIAAFIGYKVGIKVTLAKMVILEDTVVFNDNEKSLRRRMQTMFLQLQNEAINKDIMKIKKISEKTYKVSITALKG